MNSIETSGWESSFFENASEQFSAYFLDFAQTISDHTLLEMEYPNLIVTASYFRNSGRYRNLILLRDKLHTFMDLRGHWSDSIALLTWTADPALLL